MPVFVTAEMRQGGLQNGALTWQFAEWKKYNLGGLTWDLNYTTEWIFGP